MFLVPRHIRRAPMGQSSNFQVVVISDTVPLSALNAKQGWQKFTLALLT